MPIAQDIRDEMRALARQLDTTSYGERARLIEGTCQRLQLSRQTLYRRLAQVGWSSGRTTRADKGNTAQPLEDLAMIAAMQKAAVRQNGKATLKVTTAVGIAMQNGMTISVGPQRIATLLRERGLDVRTQSRQSAHVNVRSIHPNHVHQVDASLCLVYSLNGKQYVIRDDELYKNKLPALAKIKNKVWRYVLTDHTSGTIIVRYYEAAGENKFSLADFLLWAWSKKEDCPFHGVPQILIWDKGAANQSHTISSLLKSLEVNGIAHKVGNSRAKGSVEGAQNITETQLESRFRFEPIFEIDAMNQVAFNWFNAYNANQIPGQDTCLGRGHLHIARYDLWMRIRADQLRLLPDINICRALLADKEQLRTVHGNKEISFKHPKSPVALRYDLRNCDGVNVGDKVTVQAMLYGDCEALVSIESYNGERMEWRIEPVRDYDANGFRESAPIFGESFQALPQSVNEASGKALDRVAYGERSEEEIEKAKRKNEAPFGGQLNAHSYLAHTDLPNYMPRRGTEISVPDRVNMEVKPLSHFEACRTLVQLMGRALTIEENRRVAQWYPDGVPEESLPILQQAILTNTTPFRSIERKATG